MLHIFYGTDAFSISERFRELRASLDDDGSLDTNTVSFSAAEASPQEVMAACNSAPFLGARRLVVLEGALKGGRARRGKTAPMGEDGGTGGTWGALVECAGAMPESTTLVLLDGDVKGGALLNLLREVGTVHRMDVPPQKAVTGWIQKRAKTMGLSLAGGTAKILGDLVGNDTWALAGELAKLESYAGERPISPDDVREMVTPARDLPPWDLLDPIADGKGAGALRALRSMFERKHPLLIAAIIQGAFRQLAIARELLDDGASGNDVGEKVGLTGYPLEKLLDRASRYPTPMIREAYARMVEADHDIKRGAFDDQLSLELLVTDLAVSAGRSRAA